MGRQTSKAILITVIACVMCGCAAQHHVRTVTPGEPESYANRKTVEGVVIAVEPYSTPEKARRAFSVDVTKEGYLPILLVLTNRNEDDPGAKRFVRRPNFRLVAPDGERYSPIGGEMMARDMAGNTPKSGGDYSILKTPVLDIEGGSNGVELDTPVADLGLSDRGLKFDTFLADVHIPIPRIPTASSRKKRTERMQADFAQKELRDMAVLEPGNQESGFIYFKVPEPRTFHGRLDSRLYEIDGKDKWFSIQIEP